MWDEAVAKPQHGAALRKETSAQPQGPSLQIPEEALPEASPTRITLEDCQVSLLHGELLEREIKAWGSSGSPKCRRCVWKV